MVRIISQGLSQLSNPLVNGVVTDDLPVPDVFYQFVDADDFSRTLCQIDKNIHGTRFNGDLAALCLNLVELWLYQPVSDPVSY